MSTLKSMGMRFGRPSPEAASEHAENRPTLLVVDDDPDIRETIMLVFEESGYNVLEASNGQEALTVMRESPRGLVVLLDNYMPVLDGEGVLRKYCEIEGSPAPFRRLRLGDGPSLAAPPATAYAALARHRGGHQTVQYRRSGAGG